MKAKVIGTFLLSTVSVSEPASPQYDLRCSPTKIRNNVRLHRARLYLVNSEPIKLRRHCNDGRRLHRACDSVDWQ
jgi:hypothetical protein